MATQAAPGWAERSKMAWHQSTALNQFQPDYEGRTCADEIQCVWKWSLLHYHARISAQGEGLHFGGHTKPCAKEPKGLHMPWHLWNPLPLSLNSEAYALLNLKSFPLLLPQFLGNFTWIPNEMWIQMSLENWAKKKGLGLEWRIPSWIWFHSHCDWMSHANINAQEEGVLGFSITHSFFFFIFLKKLLKYI